MEELLRPVLSFRKWAVPRKKWVLIVLGVTLCCLKRQKAQKKWAEAQFWPVKVGRKKQRYVYKNG